MKVSTHVWRKPPHEICLDLQEFERQFDYPLNAQNRFRIEHSLDYGRFFAAMGDSATIVVARDRDILGVLSATIRSLETEAGSSERWLYVGDVKIDKNSRGRRVLHLLFGATRSWVNERCERGYAVVMDGTSVTPTTYTGRVDIPSFEQVTKVSLLCFPLSAVPFPATSTSTIEAFSHDPSYDLTHQPLPGPSLFPRWTGTDPAIRSEMQPTWLFNKACGGLALLEDTRRAKRLYDDHGNEIMFAHLTHLTRGNMLGIIPIINEACNRARVEGSTDLLVAIPSTQHRELLPHLREVDHQVLASTVYATDAANGSILPIASSEI